MANINTQDLINKFKRAQRELATGDPVKAIKMLEKLLKPSGNNPDILYLISLAYGKMGKMTQVEKYSRHALTKTSTHKGALCNLANALFIQGKLQEALTNYEKALSISPGEPQILDNYCRVLITTGRQSEAISKLDQVITKNPHYAPAYAVKGIAYAELGHTEKAFSAFENALKIDPVNVDANIGLGNLHRFQGTHLDAEKYYRTVLDVEPYNMLAYIGLATVKRLIGLHDEALNIIQEAELRIPGHPTIISTKADILEHAGKYNEAFDALQYLKKKGQLSSLGVVSYMNMCAKFDVCDEAMDVLNHSIELPATNNLEKQMLYFCGGKHLDKQNRYDEAFKYYKKANTCIDANFDAARDLGFVADVKEVFTEEAMKSFPFATTGSQRPLFILGMPRSGTSLTEQILSAHPEVHGAGELGDIAGIAKAIKGLHPDMEGGYAARIPGLKLEAIQSYAEKYLQSISLLNNSSRYVTDKMPHNFLYIGLISLLFPEARIIHCKRNPIDNILSIYFQHFSNAHTYATSLRNITLYYNAYTNVMEHWKKVINNPIYELCYESIIEDQEATTRKLLEFCDLEWNDDVLQYHSTKRSVATASYQQVRQPIYKTSRERWRNYETYLDEVKQLLDVN